MGHCGSAPKTAKIHSPCGADLDDCGIGHARHHGDECPFSPCTRRPFFRRSGKENDDELTNRSWRSRVRRTFRSCFLSMRHSGPDRCAERHDRKCHWLAHIWLPLGCRRCIGLDTPFSGEGRRHSDSRRPFELPNFLGDGSRLSHRRSARDCRTLRICFVASRRRSLRSRASHSQLNESVCPSSRDDRRLVPDKIRVAAVAGAS